MTVRTWLGFPLAFTLAACAAAPVDPEQTLARLGPSLFVGQPESDAVRLLEREGFHCRELRPEEWPHLKPAVVRSLNCAAQGQEAPGSYRVVYVNLGLDAARRVAELSSGSYGGGTYPAQRQ